MQVAGAKQSSGVSHVSVGVFVQKQEPQRQGNEKKGEQERVVAESGRSWAQSCIPREALATRNIDHFQ